MSNRSESVAVCPHCEHENGDEDWTEEWRNSEGDYEVTCVRCDKTFWITSRYSLMFETFKEEWEIQYVG